MSMVLRLTILFGAILDGTLGFGFLVDSQRAGADFAIAAKEPLGVSTLRGDMSAFFLVAAVFMLAGAARRRGDWLVAPLALFLVAVSGRALNLVMVGEYEGWWMPMLVETLHVAVLATAIRVFGWRGHSRP